MTLTRLGLALTAVALTAVGCRSDSSLRDIAVWNNCGSTVQVEDAAGEVDIGTRINIIDAGDTTYIGSYGDLTTLFIRVGEPPGGSGGPLDDSLPVHRFPPEDLQPVDENVEGFEYQLTLEGELCP